MAGEAPGGGEGSLASQQSADSAGVRRSPTVALAGLDPGDEHERLDVDPAEVPGAAKRRVGPDLDGERVDDPGPVEDEDDVEPAGTLDPRRGLVDAGPRPLAEAPVEHEHGPGL